MRSAVSMYARRDGPAGTRLREPVVGFRSIRPSSRALSRIRASRLTVMLIVRGESGFGFSRSFSAMYSSTLA